MHANNPVFSQYSKEDFEFYDSVSGLSGAEACRIAPEDRERLLQNSSAVTRDGLERIKF